VVGKFKVETGSVAPIQYVGLRAKIYSLLVKKDDDDDDGTEETKTAAKGIPKAYVRKNIRHKRFFAALKSKTKDDTARLQCFRTKHHVLRTIRMEKVCLNSWDDKRYIREDGISTFAHGHVRIRNGEC